jgi:7,8-dihydropterin-6-yl-methyl-4-(beta-D-ribofuranosyl)aminobenzene 5'-phosphate synthase
VRVFEFVQFVNNVPENLIETPAKNILFDTGARGTILLDNMRKLSINPSIVDAIFISHRHWDTPAGFPIF